MIRVQAPAKLNLYLRVLGKRPDGYHKLETLFERIDLADELTFEPHAQGMHLTCSDPLLSTGEENLVVKAARALEQQFGPQPGARIHLTKRIPIAAGLGGGSSDAATTLVGLNALWQLGADAATLRELGAALGADVAFFLADAPFAIGRGRGERCEPLSGIQRLAHVLVVPEAALSTRDVYAGYDQAEGLTLTGRAPSITMPVHALRNGSLSELASGLWNDLAPEAIRRCPLITQVQVQLRQLGCLAAWVSGSGPAVVGLCQDVPHAQEVTTALHRLAPLHSRCIRIVKTDDHSAATLQHS